VRFAVRSPEPHPACRVRALRRYRRREGFEGQEEHREDPVSRRVKRGEPHDRQRDETSPRCRGGASRRGGEKPRGRNTGGAWLALLRRSGRAFARACVVVSGSPAREASAGTGRELTPRLTSMEGRSLDNPKRGSPAGRSGGKDREAPGQVAPRFRRGACDCFGSSRGPIEGPRGSGCACVPKAKGAAAKANEPRLRSGLPVHARHRSVAHVPRSTCVRSRATSTKWTTFAWSQPP